MITAPPDMNDTILHTEKLVKKFKGRTVVDQISIDLNAGEVVGLLGANGAGKTTTFSMVVGLLKPNSGRIVFNGKDITRMPMYKRARSGMAYLAQELRPRDSLLDDLRCQPRPDPQPPLDLPGSGLRPASGQYRMVRLGRSHRLKV